MTPVIDPLFGVRCFYVMQIVYFLILLCFEIEELTLCYSFTASKIDKNNNNK